MCFGVIIIQSIATKSAEVYALKIPFPSIQREEQIFFIKSPCIRQLCHQRAIQHIPCFLIVLFFFRHYLIEHGACFSHGIGAKFGKEVGGRDAMFLAVFLNDFDHFLYHVCVVEMKF